MWLTVVIGFTCDDSSLKTKMYENDMNKRQSLRTSHSFSQISISPYLMVEQNVRK